MPNSKVSQNKYVQGVEGDCAGSGGDEPVDCGGVWVIGAVSAFTDDTRRGPGCWGKSCGGAGVQGAKWRPGCWGHARWGAGARGAKQRPLELRNRYQDLAVYEGENEEKDLVEINAVDGARLTRESCINFHVTDAKRPLASAVKVCEAGNRVVMEADGGYVENLKTGERMRLRKDKGTFVFDIQYSVNGNMDTITLDSGAGVSVWPADKLPEVSMTAKKPGLRMVAANGTDMKNYGQKTIRFRGLAEEVRSNADFTRRA